MTVKDVSALAGISVQAVYKRIKKRGIELNAIRSPETGQFSPEGEELMKSLFNLENASEAPKTQNTAGEERLKTALNELEKLKTEVVNLRAQLEAMTNERDYLRGALEREQTLHGMTLQKVPAALPAGKKHGLFSWFRKGGEE